jgi:hypothetical protein
MTRGVETLAPLVEGPEARRAPGVGGGPAGGGTGAQPPRG